MLANRFSLRLGNKKNRIVRPINQRIYPKYVPIERLKKLPIYVDPNNMAARDNRGITYFKNTSSISYIDI